MSTYIKRAELYDRLIHSPDIQALQKSAPVDVAAVAMGLAQVESNYQIDAAGDVDASGKAHALGLWQFNTDLIAIDGGALTDINYQISKFRGLFAQIDGAVHEVLASIGARRTAGEAINFQPARDIPHFYNVAWQYGQGGMQAWALHFNDLTVAGFKNFRLQHGKPVDDRLPDRSYSRRASSFRSRFDQVVADAPDFWNTVVATSMTGAAAVAVSVATAPLAAPIAVGEGAYELGKKAADDLANSPAGESWWDKLAKKVETLALFGALLSGLVVAGLVFGIWALFRLEARRA